MARAPIASPQSPQPELPLRIVAAQADDLEAFLDLLEELADWLASRGIRQWPRGQFRASALFYAESIEQGEVQLAFLVDELVGAIRVIPREPIVWPEVADDDAVYVHNLAVRREWANYGLGRRLLAWAEDRAASAGKAYVRLDCISDNAVLRRYYLHAGFEDCGDIDAVFPEPVGTLRLRRYRKTVRRRAVQP
jgi:ribosomal protein S18 acetylase RimI-like enzyme